jgi:hypothetical protein
MSGLSGKTTIVVGAGGGLGHGDGHRLRSGRRPVVVAGSCTTAPFDEPHGTAGTIQREAAGATVPASLIGR